MSESWVDQERADNYLLVKEVFDILHRDFIKKSLKKIKFELDSLEEFKKLYHDSKNKKAKNTEEGEKNEGEKSIYKKLRKQVEVCFNKKELEYKKELENEKELEYEKKLKYKYLYSADQINEKWLYAVIERHKDAINDAEKYKKAIDVFNKKALYFKTYHKCRENIYSTKDTSIAHRLVDDNLPKFIDNIDLFEKIKDIPEMQKNFQKLYADFPCIENIADIFKLEFYNHVLTQEQIAYYNLIIGGKTEEQGEAEKIKGLNEYIKEYNDKQNDTKSHLPAFKELFKQILSERVPISYIPEEFKGDAELIKAVKDSYEKISRLWSNQKEKENLVKNLLLNNPEGKGLRLIYIPNTSLGHVSEVLYEGDKDFLQEAMKAKYYSIDTHTSKDEIEKDWKEYFESFEYFSLSYLDECVECVSDERKREVKDCLEIDDCKNDVETIFDRIDKAYSDAKDLFCKEDPKIKILSKDEDSIKKIKTLMDNIKVLQHFIKKEVDADDINKHDIEEALVPFSWLYDMVRNYLTKKPFSKKKTRLYFGNNGNFLIGWVDSYTEDVNKDGQGNDNGTKGGYLFRKKVKINGIDEYDYYLGISTNPRLFREKKETIEEGDYEQLDYYQIGFKTITGKMYENCSERKYGDDVKELKSAIQEFLTPMDTDEIKKIKKVKEVLEQYRLIKEKEVLYKKLLKYPRFAQINRIIIENLKRVLSKVTRISMAQEIVSSDYTSVEIIKRIKELPTEKKYYAVSAKEIEETMKDEDKPLLLFKIENKDLSYARTYLDSKRKSRGTENLHTMFFKALMEEDMGIDIGSGMVFYREKSLKPKNNKGEQTNLKDTPVHKKGTKIFNKTNSDSKILRYDLIKDKRYTENQLTFHLSMTLNYKSKGERINEKVNRCLRESDDFHIIGIDRGERNLLYLSLINSKGEIVNQFSLNEIRNEYKQINYHDLLNTREVERDKARKNWKPIEDIKNLKEGYLSQAIHVIAQLIVEYKAIVVLEDLNQEFMRGRQKIEKQIYQKFEKMLIDKLNYLVVDKKQDPSTPGGLLQGLQLTNKFTSFKDMRGQNGILFYVPAWNTSKIDPVTGFVNLFNSSHFNSTGEEAKEFFGKFKKIGYNKEQDWFEFEFDYNDFPKIGIVDKKKARKNDKSEEKMKTDWKLCSHGKRLIHFPAAPVAIRKHGEKTDRTKEINLTEEFKSVFEQFGVELTPNMTSAICNVNSPTFYKKLLTKMKWMLQLRNTRKGIGKETGEDYLLSPVANEQGVFFDSREYDGKDCDNPLPENADANGAYNIARKGLWMIKQIRQAKNPKLAMSNKEWLIFAQTKPYLND